MSDCSTHAFDVPKQVMRLHAEFDSGKDWDYQLALNGRELVSFEIDGVKYVPERTCTVLDGVKYVPERTCTVIGTRFEDLLVEYCHSLSCGDDAWNGDTEPPRYCEECGAKVRKVDECQTSR